MDEPWRRERSSALCAWHADLLPAALGCSWGSCPPWELLGRVWGDPSGGPVRPWGPRVTRSSHGTLSPL